MRARLAAAAAILLVIGTLALSGCGSSSASADAEFAPGAFPPILTGEEYHVGAWTRTDCLTCHEEGLDDAPKMRHVSVVEIAADSKCRTCHVLILEEKARK